MHSTRYSLLATRYARGFTILELVISITIIAIISMMAGVELINYQRLTAAEAAARDIMGELRLAQSRAITGEDGDLNGQGDAWGMQFANPSGAGDDNYKIFYGTVYNSASTTATFYLPSSVMFTNPTEGNNKDIIFTKLTGTATSSSITIQTVDGSQTKTITIATSTISVQ